MLLIKNGHIKTMAGADIENGSVLVGDDGKIVAVGVDITPPTGAEIIDAEGRLVTPGLVEAHCHIGVRSSGMRWEGVDHNEKTDPVVPHLRAIDGLNPIDETFPQALSGGVTTACTGPGSSNVVGGSFTAIKLFGKRVDNMIIRDIVAMKCAFGENPKGAYGESGKTPKTRMAIAALLRELLFKTRRYLAAKEAGKDPTFDMKLEAMIPVIKREIPLKAHAHTADDIFTAIRIAKEFNVRLTLDHCTDGKLIADELAKEGYPALVGPTFGSKSKIELRNKGFDTVAALYEAGVPLSIITDAPVLPLESLSFCAGMAVSHGLPYEAGWQAITINPARAMSIDDRVGSLEVGKDGDIVIWNADPITTVGAAAHLTVIEGKIVYTAK